MKLDPWPSCRVARVVITPDSPLALAGYLNRREPSEGVASALEGNLLLTAVDGAPLLMIALDTLFGSEALCEGIVRRLAASLPGLSPERVQLIASHTHYAPSLDPSKPCLGIVDEEYFAFCIERIATAIETVLPRPATEVQTCRRGQATCLANVYRRLETWVRERRSLRFRREYATAPDTRVAVDHQLRIARLVGEDDETLCVLWSWPCHAVSRGETRTISADFPGAVRDVLRERYGEGLPVLYFPGFCGDLRPFSHRARRSMRDLLAMPFARGFEVPDAASHAALCRTVANAALRADADTEGWITDAGPPVETSIAGVEKPLTRLLDGYAGSAGLRCTHLSLPPLRFALLGAEVCSGYADAVADIDFPSGYANAVFGYLPTSSQVVEGGYEVDGFMPAFSLEGRFRTDIDGVVRTLLGGDGAVRDAVGAAPRATWFGDRVQE